jgi:hypothetical protein
LIEIDVGIETEELTHFLNEPLEAFSNVNNAIGFGALLCASPDGAARPGICPHERGEKREIRCIL